MMMLWHQIKETSRDQPLPGHDKGCLSPKSRRLVNPVKGPSKTQIATLFT